MWSPSRLSPWPSSFSDINDLFHSSKYLSFILFADDTSIFYRHKDIQTLINTVNSELCLVSSWFKANKLTLHPDKTKFILFHPSRKKVNLDEIHISINGAPLSRVDNTKFLGVIIHQNLTWKPHISAVKEKTSKVIGVMCKSRQYLPSNTLKTLYNSLFLPYINYCNIIWASTYDSHLEPLFYYKRKRFALLPSHLLKLTPSPFSINLIFCLSTLSSSAK